MILAKAIASAIILGIVAGLCLIYLTGCATTGGVETASLQAHAAAAQASVQSARHSGKEVIRLSDSLSGHLGSSSGFLMRADGKTGRAIQTLRDSLR